MSRDREDPPAPLPDARSDVAAEQRARLLTAVVAVAGEQGWEQTTLRAVVARAGVSRRTLYDLFADKEDCFLTAAKALTERVATITTSAYDGAPEPRAGLAHAIASLFAFLAREPSAARVYLVETAIAGPAGASLWSSHMKAMSARTRCALDAIGADPSRHSETMAVGGVYTVARNRVLLGRTRELAQLAPEVQRALWLTLGVDGVARHGRREENGDG